MDEKQKFQGNVIYLYPNLTKAIIGINNLFIYHYRATPVEACSVGALEAGGVEFNNPIFILDLKIKSKKNLFEGGIFNFFCGGNGEIFSRDNFS